MLFTLTNKISNSFYLIRHDELTENKTPKKDD